MANDQLDTANKALKAHAADPRARMFKLDTSLRAVADALDELDRRQGSLAAAYLLLVEALADGRKLTMHPAALDDLAAMNDHAHNIASRLRARVCGGG